jgi:hypothetical protein
MNRLERVHHKPDGANKYHINCQELEKYPSSIQISLEKVIKNKNDVTILESIITDKTITSKQKHIVVKIGNISKTIEKEFYIGKILENKNISGFIRYMCLFVCYDNSYHNINENKVHQLCSAKKEEENQKAILVMPFVQEGSIKNFNWFNDDKFDILKSILQQVILSLFISYKSCGFLHNDLHLDNILLKKTKKQTIDYILDEKGTTNTNISIKTHGYKALVMDFDSSMINVDIKSGIEFYWRNIYNMMSRIETDLKNKKSVITVSNNNNLISFISEQSINNNQNHNNGNNITIKLVNMIDDMKFKILSLPTEKKYVYNPFEY